MNNPTPSEDDSTERGASDVRVRDPRKWRAFLQWAPHAVVVADIGQPVAVDCRGGGGYRHCRGGRVLVPARRRGARDSGDERQHATGLDLTGARHMVMPMAKLWVLLVALALVAGCLAPEYAVATLNGPCKVRLAKACAAYNSSDRLVCDGRKWRLSDSCGTAERCDTQPGLNTTGLCVPVASACVGHQPDDLVCDGLVRRQCGRDLVTYEDVAQCEAGFECAEGECVNIDECSRMAGVCTHAGTCTDTAPGYTCSNCAVGSRSNGATFAQCTDVDECDDNPGVCTRGGTCTNADPGYACANCAAGSQVTGETFPSCADIDECGDSNVCESDYPCLNRDPDYTCRGQFPDWSVSTWSNFTISNGVATDTKTGLEWQQLSEGRSPNLAAAKTYCDDLSLAGQNDWRLPTIAELRSIVDRSMANPASDSTIFPTMLSMEYWTASPYVGLAGHVWYVDFYGGWSGYGAATGKTRSTRCVR